MKPALDQRLAQGEEILLGRTSEVREVRIPRELGSVSIFTRANMELPVVGRKIEGVDIPLGTVTCVGGTWVWTPSRSISQSTLVKGNTLQIGRGTLNSDNQAISRSHFSLTLLTEGTLVVQDEHSKNGTWVVKLER